MSTRYQAYKLRNLVAANHNASKLWDYKLHKVTVLQSYRLQVQKGSKICCCKGIPHSLMAHKGPADIYDI